MFIYLITIETRSIHHDLDSMSHRNSITDNDRHQLEHSPAIQTLRWTPRKLEQSEICDLCDAAVPMVGEQSLSKATQEFIIEY